jgi:hypothetical protein
MDPSQVSAIPAQRSYRSKFLDSVDSLLQTIKDEYNDPLSDHDERDDYDGTVYKPRPQLPQPFVCMRSLADIISE